MNPTSGENACQSSYVHVHTLTNQFTRQLYPVDALIRIAINAVVNWVILTVRPTRVPRQVPGHPGVGGAYAQVRLVVLAINGARVFVWDRPHATEAKAKLVNAGQSAHTSGQPGPPAP